MCDSLAFHTSPNRKGEEREERHDKSRHRRIERLLPSMVVSHLLPNMAASVVSRDPEGTSRVGEMRSSEALTDH